MSRDDWPQDPRTSDAADRSIPIRPAVRRPSGAMAPEIPDSPAAAPRGAKQIAVLHTRKRPGFPRIRPGTGDPGHIQIHRLQTGNPPQRIAWQRPEYRTSTLRSCPGTLVRIAPPSPDAAGLRTHLPSIPPHRPHIARQNVPAIKRSVPRCPSSPSTCISPSSTAYPCTCCKGQTGLRAVQSVEDGIWAAFSRSVPLHYGNAGW